MAEEEGAYIYLKAGIYNTDVSAYLATGAQQFESGENSFVVQTQEQE
jgi:hypothetical protein